MADFLQVEMNKEIGERQKEEGRSSLRQSAPRRERREDRWEGRPIKIRQRYEKYTPLSERQAQVLETVKKKLREDMVTWPWTRREGPTQPKSGFYCRFHKDYGHTTDECRHLKDEIERLIRFGHLKEFIYKDRERKRARPLQNSGDKRQRPEDRNEESLVDKARNHAHEQLDRRWRR